MSAVFVWSLNEGSFMYRAYLSARFSAGSLVSNVQIFLRIPNALPSGDAVKKRSRILEVVNYF